MKNINFKAKHSKGLTPLKIALIYSLVSFIWILSSDSLLSLMSSDPEFMTRIQSYKGVTFITISAILIFFLTKKGVKQHKLSQEKLFQSQKRYREIFNAPSDAIIIHDAVTGQILDLNNAMVKMFSYTSKEEVLSLSITDLSIKMDEFNHEAALKKITAAAKGVPQQFEWLSKKKNGDIFPSEVTLRFLRLDEKDCVLAVVRDITERKIAEEKQAKLADQLHQSRKMEAIGQLAGGIAHDFNNMLNGIVGSAELIKLKKDDIEKIEKYSDLIINSANKAGNLTKQLLTFSRKATKTTANINVSYILNETADLLRRTINKAVEINIENRAINPHIMGDDYLIQNCFINMGINADHAMPEGGTLTFSMENIVLDEVYCSSSQFNISPGEFLKISVSDTGTGMPPEVLQRIFEPFFTTKAHGQGTGLGLSAVYGTIYDHKGAISASSKEGKGSLFNIYFPVSKSGVAIEKTPGQLIRGKGTILLIDDEEIIRKVGKSQLEELGYEVIIADNGKSGFEKFKENISKIDLIILDMIMPVMGGREVFNKIREMDKIVPILISSGFSREGDFDEMNKKGLNGILHKPFLIDELGKKIFDAMKKNSLS